METRTVIEVKLYFLIMNMMRNKSESQSLVIISDSREKIIQYYNDNIVPLYEDKIMEFEGEHTYRKNFKKGSELEWMNPLFDLNTIDYNGFGIREEWFNFDTFQIEIDTRWPGVLKLF